MYGLPFVMIDNPAAPNDARRPVITNFNSVGFRTRLFDHREPGVRYEHGDGWNPFPADLEPLRGAKLRHSWSADKLRTRRDVSSNRLRLAERGHNIGHRLLQNKIGPNGKEPPTFESGIMGLGINTVTLRCWALENYFYHNAEDNIQILAAGGRGGPAQSVYIGGNTFDGNGENAVDIKQSVRCDCLE